LLCGDTLYAVGAPGAGSVTDVALSVVLIAVSVLVIMLVLRHTIVYLRKRYFKYVREKRES